jgi:hypothetical protein
VLGKKYRSLSVVVYPAVIRQEVVIHAYDYSRGPWVDLKKVEKLVVEVLI